MVPLKETVLALSVVDSLTGYVFIERSLDFLADLEIQIEQAIPNILYSGDSEVMITGMGFTGECWCVFENEAQEHGKMISKIKKKLAVIVNDKEIRCAVP